MSNNQVSATGVTYSYTFKTGSVGIVGKVVFAVSGAGLAGVPTITKTYGIGAGTVARVGQVITYTVTAPVSIAAGIPIYIELAGLTNGSPAGSYTTSVATQTAAAVAIDGPTTTNAVLLAANNTAITVTIDKSLTFTLDTTAMEFDMDPSLPACRPEPDRRHHGTNERQLWLHLGRQRQRSRTDQCCHREPHHCRCVL